MTRAYPNCCTSALCGRTSCPLDCPNLATLAEFKRWRERTRAVVKDRVWSPLIYTATEPDRS